MHLWHTSFLIFSLFLSYVAVSFFKLSQISKKFSNIFIEKNLHISGSTLTEVMCRHYLENTLVRLGTQSKFQILYNLLHSLTTPPPCPRKIKIKKTLNITHHPNIRNPLLLLFAALTARLKTYLRVTSCWSMLGSYDFLNRASFSQWK